MSNMNQGYSAVSNFEPNYSGVTLNRIIQGRVTYIMANQSQVRGIAYSGERNMNRSYSAVSNLNWEYIGACSMSRLFRGK